jgi:hypothetical protein
VGCSIAPRAEKQLPRPATRAPSPAREDRLHLLGCRTSFTPVETLDRSFVIKFTRLFDM